MKIQSKSQFLNFFGIISLFIKNKSSKSQKMKEWERESVNKAISKISEYPTFTKVPVTQAPDNLDVLNNILEGMAALAKNSLRNKAIKYDIPYEKCTNWQQLLGAITKHEHKIMLQSKANRYNIPYNKQDIDWETLDEKVTRWERLFNEAWSLRLKVDITKYDPIGLEQRIEEELYKSRQEMKDLRDDYYRTIL